MHYRCISLHYSSEGGLSILEFDYHTEEEAAEICNLTWKEPKITRFVNMKFQEAVTS